MYLKMPSATDTPVYESVMVMLADLFADRIQQVGELDLVVVGQLAIRLQSDSHNTDPLDKLEVVYNYQLPPPNHSWLTSTRTKWLPRHVNQMDVSFTQNGQRFSLALPVMKLPRMKKLYNSPPISDRHFQYLLRIEEQLELERLLKR